MPVSSLCLLRRLRRFCFLLLRRAPSIQAKREAVNDGTNWGAMQPVGETRGATQPVGETTNNCEDWCHEPPSGDSHAPGSCCCAHRDSIPGLDQGLGIERIVV